MLVLILYVTYLFHTAKVSWTWWKKWPFVKWLLFIVTLSGVYVTLSGQAISETYRVYAEWYLYLILFVFIYHKFTIEELFRAITIFSFLWMVMWILGYLAPFPMYDASGEFDSEYLMTEGRGVIRLKVSGSCIMQMWGLWCLSIYIDSHKKKYLAAFIACFTFTVLLVSRQHIVAYAALGLFFLLIKENFSRKILLMGILYGMFTIYLSQTKIYQNLTELTEEQMYENEGGKEDVRIKAWEYYVTEYPTNLYCVLFGHGLYHAHSKQGKEMSMLIFNTGYVLADIGFVGLYIYFGLAGLLCFLFLFLYVYRIKVPQSFYGIKLFIYFLFLTNVFSHNIEQSILECAMSLFILYMANLKMKTMKMMDSVELNKRLI